MTIAAAAVPQYRSTAAPRSALQHAQQRCADQLGNMRACHVKT